MKTNLTASVHQRLLNFSKKHDAEFNSILSRYTIERFLYRLSVSSYADRFVLKGATLFLIWSGQLYRPTRDIDLLGYGELSPENIRHIFSTICTLAVEPDGLSFDAESIRLQAIKETHKYPGTRVTLYAFIGKARIRTQIDIGFGDIVIPATQQVEYPGLLNFPAPKLIAYPKETVIAEKLETMVDRGALNSRMKDFFDLRIMSQQFIFDGIVLTKAIKTTFTHRQTPFPKNDPIALTTNYAATPNARLQWHTFVSRNRLPGETTDFIEVIAKLRNFLLPPFQAAQNDRLFANIWHSDKGWHTKS